MADSFTARLKTALVGDPTARFVYLNNFEVERNWGQDEPGLPGAGLSFSSAMVNRMEEVGVLLADEHDAVVLKGPLDPGHADYLRGLGVAAGRQLVVDDNEPQRSITADVLASPRLLADLAAMADGRTYLMPLGVSADEEALAARTGLPLAAPSAAVCKQVNGKIYSRELVDAAGLAAVPGAECRTLDELAAALDAHVVEGSRVVVKESLGVSGRGMVVLDSPKRASQLLRLLQRRGSNTVSLVVERWIDKVADLNYQFILGRGGDVRFETVKTAFTENGVHRGHLFPPALRADQVGELEAAASVLGKTLSADGYYGVVGVDAMLGVDGTLYPCLEINARFNMATYQNRVAERLVGDGRCALAATYDLKPTRAHGFDEVRTALGSLLFDGGRGVLVNNFATLNAAVLAGAGAYGRVYAICVGESVDEVRTISADAESALRGMVERP
jgi:Pre ATP-grasp domain/ATP-grasp domain